MPASAESVDFTPVPLGKRSRDLDSAVVGFWGMLLSAAWLLNPIASPAADLDSVLLHPVDVDDFLFNDEMIDDAPQANGDAVVEVKGVKVMPEVIPAEMWAVLVPGFSTKSPAQRLIWTVHSFIQPL